MVGLIILTGATLIVIVGAAYLWFHDYREYKRKGSLRY